MSYEDFDMLVVDDESAKCQSIKTAKDYATELQKYEPSNKRIIQWIQNATMSATVGRSSASLRKRSVFNSIITHYS